MAGRGRKKSEKDRGEDARKKISYFRTLVNLNESQGNSVR